MRSDCVANLESAVRQQCRGNQGRDTPEYSVRKPTRFRTQEERHKEQSVFYVSRHPSFASLSGKSKGMSLRSINSGTLSPIRNVTRASFFSDLLLRSASSRQFFQYFSSFLSIRSVSRLLSLSISFPERLYGNNLACVRV